MFEQSHRVPQSDLASSSFDMIEPHSSPLESKDLVFELADRTSLVEAQALCGLLQAADHGRRTAEQDLDVVGWGGEPFLGQSVAQFTRLRLTANDHNGSGVRERVGHPCLQ